MKISRNELRQMIFETLLREQKSSPRRRGRRNSPRRNRENNSKGSAQPAAPAPPSAPPPPSAAAPAPPPPSAPAKKKVPNQKIKTVQELLNFFLPDDQQIKKIDGYWTPKIIDPAMKTVMTSFNVPEPGRAWTKMAPGLGVSPTIQGLIDYLTKKAKESEEAETAEGQAALDSIYAAAEKAQAIPPKDNTATDSGDQNKRSENDMKDEVILKMAAFEIDLTGTIQDNRDFYKNNNWSSLLDFLKTRKNINQTLSKEALAKMILDRDTDVPGNIVSQFKRNKNYAGLLRHMNDKQIGFDLQGSDSDFPQGFKQNLRDAIARALGLDPAKYSSIPVNESRITYGKSHATLLRERYWGRY